LRQRSDTDPLARDNKEDWGRSYNNTIGGLLKTNTLEKKAVYYAQRAYADITPDEQVERPISNPVEVVTQDPSVKPKNIIALAGPEQDKKKVLVAYADVAEEQRQSDDATIMQGTGQAVEPAKGKKIQLTITDEHIHKGDNLDVTQTQIVNTPDNADGVTTKYKDPYQNPFAKKRVQAQADGQLAIVLENVQPGELREVVIQ
jgi:hypothetical protein